MRTERTSGASCTNQMHVSAYGANMRRRMFFQLRGPSPVPCIFCTISQPLHFLYHFITTRISVPFHNFPHFPQYITKNYGKLSNFIYNCCVMYCHIQKPQIYFHRFLDRQHKSCEFSCEAKRFNPGGEK